MNRSIIFKRYLQDVGSFETHLSSLSISTRWYSGNYFFWLKAFDTLKCNYQDSLNILEIGSWEGVSASFLMRRFPESQLTCVDTWKGSDELQSDNEETIEFLNLIEKNFNNNLSQFSDRLNKIKMSSNDYFQSVEISGQYFDIIYVDGSHFADDVLMDVLQAWKRLKAGGIMICDDFMWQFYKNPYHNPARALISFYNLKCEELEIVDVYDQIVFVKKY